jgi:hypothetical protein
VGRWIWLGGSLLLGVVATQTAWWMGRRDESQAWPDSLVRSPLSSVAVQIARFLYYIGLPFCALVWGRDAVVGRHLGLQPLVSPVTPAAHWADWARDLGWGVGLGLAAWIILAVGWRAVRRAGVSPEPAGVYTSTWILLREAAFQEVHWSFYRNALVVVLGASLGASLGTYWGVWIGLGLVTLEAGLNPWWRAALEDAARAPAALVRAGLAVLSAALYLAVLVHWGVTWGLAGWVRAFPLRDHPTLEASTPI